MKATIIPLGRWVVWPLLAFEVHDIPPATRVRHVETLTLSLGPLSVVVTRDTWRAKEKGE
jgi:hypothetical protein